MVTIPKNTVSEQTYVDRFVAQIVDELKTRDSAEIYRCDNHYLTEDIARKVGNEFKKQGYYARLEYLVERGFRNLTVSKKPLGDWSARMAWGETI